MFVCIPKRQISTTSLQTLACVEHVLEQVVLTRLDSNIRPASEKPMRNGEVCPKYRTEPFEKPVHNDRLLELAGVKAY